MKHILSATALIVTAFALAACLSPNTGGPANNLNADTGINGQWVDGNGIISSFHNGVFETRAPDTREKIAEGNYLFSNPQLVEIEMRSIVRGTVSRVNCKVANNSTALFCTTGTGSHFSLTRKA